MQAAEEQFAIETLKVYDTFARAGRALLFFSNIVSVIYIFKIKYTNMAPRFKKNPTYTSLYRRFLFFNPFSWVKFSSSRALRLQFARLFVCFNLDAGRVWITTSLKTAFVFSLIQQTFPRRISKSWNTCCKVGALLYFPK